MARSVVLSGGECPTCFDSGALLLMIGSPGERLVVYCPACGCAWESLAEAARSARFVSLNEIGIQGIRPASRAELDAMGLAKSIHATYEGDYLHWSRMD